MYQQFGLRITKVNKYKFILCASVSAKSSASSALLRGWRKSFLRPWKHREKSQKFPFSGWRSRYTIDAPAADSHKLNQHKFHIQNMLFVFLPARPVRLDNDWITASLSHRTQVHLSCELQHCVADKVSLVSHYLLASPQRPLIYPRISRAHTSREKLI